VKCRDCIHFIRTVETPPGRGYCILSLEMRLARDRCEKFVQR